MRILRNILAIFGAVSLVVATDCAWAWSNFFISGGGSGGIGFFDSWITQVLAGITAAIIIAVILLSFVMRVSRRAGLLMVAWLIERHGMAERRSYHALWLERKAVKLWRRVNPGDRKKSAAAIRRVILAGYGLDPKAMPKVVKEPKMPPVYEGPRVVVDNGWRRAA